MADSFTVERVVLRDPRGIIADVRSDDQDWIDRWTDQGAQVERRYRQTWVEGAPAPVEVDL